MSLIQIQHLTFSYDGSPEPVFEDVSLRLDTNWRLGLIGRNGRGKTTLLRLLLGQLEYSGTISAPTAFDFFPHPVSDLSRAALDVAEEAAGDAPGWMLERELSLLEVPEEALSRPFGQLSGGEQTKILLAALFLGDHRFPLIDEPTNHLDAAGRRAVSRYLRGKDGFLLVSHDRAFLDGCVDHILALNRTGLEVQSGSFSSWYRNKTLRDQFEEAENEKLKQEIGRLNQAARQASDWSDQAEKGKFHTLNSGIKPDRGYLGHKAAKMMKRSKSLENRLGAAAEEKAALLKNVERAPALKLHPLPYPAGRLAELKDVSVFYGTHAVCRGVSFTVERGDRVALCGGNGSGKSSLMKLLCGLDLSYTGQLRRGGGLILSQVPQDASVLSGSLAGFEAERELDVSLFRAILRKLDFSRELFDRDLASYSAGQKKKVLLAGSLSRSAHLYVWDEPLNYIDIFSRMQLEELLREFPCTLLFTEHDAAFTDAVATKRVVL